VSDVVEKTSTRRRSRILRSPRRDISRKKLSSAHEQPSRAH